MAELDGGGSYLWSLFNTTFKRFGSFSILKDYLCRVKLETLVEKIESSLESIEQVLDDAEIKQYKSIKVKKWVGDVKHAMYEAAQLLDEIATDEALKKSQLSIGSIVFPPLPNNPFKSRIQELMKSLDSLALKIDTLGLKQGTCASNKVGLGPKPSKRLPTTSLVDKSDIHGRDGDIEKLIKFLLDSDDGKKENDRDEIVDLSILSDDEEENANDNQGPAVISIVGLGGMGKTTLAQLVFNDHRMEEQFKLKAWVYVSESFDDVGLTKAILGSFQSSTDGENLNLLQQQLQQRLRGKKYLLVLDDVWNANEEHWELLLRPLNHGSSGSKIVVTTRTKEVARSIALKANKVHDLKQLDESYCWELFERHAFPGSSVSEYPSFESIGKRLVDKCRGLPLALKTLGKLLRKKFSPQEWEKILDTDLWRLWEGDINVNPVLRLGYHHLHANLKRCFAYCYIFPKGYIFNEDELIKLWMAEGLLCDPDEKEEEVGRKFFYDLESISFFQPPPREFSWNDRLYFVMHDLVNDLAKSVSEEFYLPVENVKAQDIDKRTRHISCFLERGGRKISLDHVNKIEGLRSLMVQPKDHFYKERWEYERKPFYNCAIVQQDLFSRLKYLRMLSLYGCDLSVVADEISNLKLLRYLDLSRTGIKKLPDSICMLYNLQTLILQNCELTELPWDFYKLVNLRHLDLLWTSITKMPKQIGSLTHLHTLTNFVVGEQSGCDVKELAKLNNLEGKLDISGLQNIIDPTDAAEANLKDKKYLEELRMRYKRHNDEEMDGSIIEREVSVLEALQPNGNLNRLSIQRYGGSRFPIWLSDYQLLLNLESLELSGCKFCSLLPSLGKLPSLKELRIQNCDAIDRIGEEFYGSNNSSSNVQFRSLKFLSFYDMSEWKEWLGYEGCFLLLEVLSIRNCPKLKKDLPHHLPSLKKLQIVDCNELEASIPKADNLTRLMLDRCESISVNELPSSLIEVSLWGENRFPLSSTSLQQNLLNCAFLEELSLDVSGFVECSSMDLHSCTSCLRDLSITTCYSSLPFAQFSTNLHSLGLYHCPQLELFPAGCLPSSLSKLTISNCPELSASRGEWGLPSSLSWLEIENCPKLIASREEWGLHQLKSLEILIVSDEFEDVESFPEVNLLPPTLDLLILTNCSKLRIINSKGLLHLKPLTYLYIEDCPCLERLPEEGLPKSLSTLSIHDDCSSQLAQLYKKEGGECWHKICHIPTVEINDELQI